jgi:hypothetical protein
VKLAELRDRAEKMIAPRQLRMENEFQTSLTAAAFEYGVPESRKSRTLERLTTNHVRERIELVHRVLDEVVSTTHAMVSERDLRELFTALCPSLDALRTNVYARFVGSNMGVSSSLACDFESAYRAHYAIAIESLALHAYDVSLPGPFKGRKIVFISCGQCTAEERALGLEMARLIETYTEYEAYFAQNEQSLDGVTTRILGALGACIGFVGVMHQRGEVSGRRATTARGSVWVEQEIALVSYRVQVLGHSLPILTYVQEGIALEGLRQVILLNSEPFKTNDDVLTDFGRRLSAGSFLRVRETAQR